MGRVYEKVDERMAAFLAAQPVFFVATAPLSADGHVNVSPKGISGTFTVVDPNTVAYLDLTGSGVETIAHLRENGRITLMFCAFEGAARIVRLHGRGRAHLCGSPEFESLIGRFPELPGVRSVVVVELSRISDSCGFGVPQMATSQDRGELAHWAELKGPDGVATYQREKNAQSLDGLPGVVV